MHVYSPDGKLALEGPAFDDNRGQDFPLEAIGPLPHPNRIFARSNHISTMYVVRSDVGRPGKVTVTRQARARRGLTGPFGSFREAQPDHFAIRNAVPIRG